MRGLILLHCVSLLVPRAFREEWLCEWRGELWQLRRRLVSAEGFDWQGDLEALRFLAGAFPDALTLRHEQLLERRSFLMPPRGTATHCMIGLFAFALVCLCVTAALPDARTAIGASPYRGTGSLLLVGARPGSNMPLPIVRVSQFSRMAAVPQHFFTGFAFYQPTQKTLRAAAHREYRIPLASATPNLFDLLGLPIRYATKQNPASQNAANEHTPLPRLILNDAAWRKYFQHDPSVFGRTVRVGGRDVLLAGVISRSDWRLPGSFEAWLLEPDARLSEFSTNSRGFVIARRYPGAVIPADESTLTILHPGGGADSFTCVALTALLRLPLDLYLLALLLALLALPATTPLGLGEYPGHSHRLSASRRFRRWIFLLSKISLVLPAVGLASFDLACAGRSLGPYASEYIQLTCTFSGSLFAMRWILRDQRLRCPVCLGCLGSPAWVGQKSCNFLGWYGAELICNEGHGLLHIPELPTSWFGTQRWLYLDPSWDVLFERPA